MRTRTTRVLALLVATVALAAACSSNNRTETGSSGTTTGTAGGGAASGVTVKIGAQDFGESAILGEVYGQALAAKGYKVEQKALGGYRDIALGAFDKGEINFTAEYAASLLEFLNNKKGEATSDVNETVAKLETYLPAKNLVAAKPASAVNTNAFVVRKDTADQLGLKSLSDLAAKGADLKLGGPADCATNPFCIPGLKQTYGLDLSKSFVGLDAGVVATALQNKEIDVAVLFSTSGVIADKGWVLLEDDKKMLAADNVIPVMTKSLAETGGQSFLDVVNAVTAKLTTEGLIEMNKQYDIDKESAKDIAATWLKANGFVG